MLPRTGARFERESRGMDKLQNIRDPHECGDKASVSSGNTVTELKSKQRGKITALAISGLSLLVRVVQVATAAEVSRTQFFRLPSRAGEFYSRAAHLFDRHTIHKAAYFWFVVTV